MEYFGDVRSRELDIGTVQIKINGFSLVKAGGSLAVPCPSSGKYIMRKLVYKAFITNFITRKVVLVIIAYIIGYIKVYRLSKFLVTRITLKLGPLSPDLNRI